MNDAPAAVHAADPGNPARGEATIVLDGTSFVMRPTYAMITRIERETGRALLQLVTAVAEMTLPLPIAALAICRLINAGGEASGDEGAKLAMPSRIEELIYESEGGLTVALLALLQVLTAAATGGYTASGEVKATRMSGTTTAPGIPVAA